MVLKENVSLPHAPLCLSANKSSQNAHRNFSVSASNYTCLNSTIAAITLPLSTYEICLLCMFSTIFILSLTANGILLLSSWKKRSSAGGWLLFYLVIVNFFQTTLILPWNFIAIIRPNMDPFFGTASWQNVGKGAVSFFFEWCTRFSWLLVALIAVERFYACVHSLTYRKKFSLKRFKGLILTIFLLTTFVSLLPFLARMDADYHPNRRFYSMQRAGSTFYFVMDILFFTSSSAVMLYCWGRIFLLAWSKRLKVYVGNIAAESATESVDGVTAGVRADASTASVSEPSENSGMKNKCSS